jgi:tRNA threonylcarbamoyladenosine biosynthesis protein TsaE
VKIEIINEPAMKAFGARLGSLLKGGDVIELIGDVGAGKTTLTKGLATGLQIDEDVQSPSFTISRVYDRAADATRLAHYDFYRLQDAGIMANELFEATRDPDTITVIEWADIVTGVLPEDHLTLVLSSPTETSRIIELTAHGARAQQIVEALA